MNFDVHMRDEKKNQFEHNGGDAYHSIHTKNEDRERIKFIEFRKMKFSNMGIDQDPLFESVATVAKCVKVP